MIMFCFSLEFDLASRVSLKVSGRGNDGDMCNRCYLMLRAFGTREPRHQSSASHYSISGSRDRAIGRHKYWKSVIHIPCGAGMMHSARGAVVVVCLDILAADFDRRLKRLITQEDIAAKDFKDLSQCLFGLGRISLTR